MKKILNSPKALAAVALAMMATGAEAHVGAPGHVHGFYQGFLHPLTGFDHMLVMVAVGMFAARIGGRALVLVPLSFMAMMVGGGVLGIAGIPVPFVEVAIALSVVVLGAVVALQWKAPVAVAMALAGVFAVFHGVAHGVEMPNNASGISYAAGFVAATGLLHAAGLAIGVGLGRMRQTSLT